MAEGVSIKGLKEVDQRLSELSSVAGTKAMRTAMFAAAKPIMQQAIQNIAQIPTGSGALAKATRRVFLRPTSISGSSTGSRFVVSIAPKTKDKTAIALANLHYKRKRPIRGVYWGHLVEWGFNHRGGGRVAGRHVYERALQSRAEEAIAIFREKLEAAITRALKAK